MIHTRIRFNIFQDLGKVSSCVSLCVTDHHNHIPGQKLDENSRQNIKWPQCEPGGHWPPQTGQILTWAWFYDVWSEHDVPRTELFLNPLEKVLVSFLPLDIVATLFSIYSDIKWSSDGNKWCRQFRLFLLTRFISVWIQYMHSHLH